MTINGSTQYSSSPVLLSNAQVNTSDYFGTHNNLFAGQIGADAGFNLGRFTVNVFSKVALGDNRETVVINGNTQVSSAPGLGNINTAGGFYAQPSNIGQYRRDEFSVLPEAGINLGFKISEHLRLAAGYTFVYFSNVVRPGDQVDGTAGGATRPPLSFLGGPHPQPVFNNFNETSFWAQGINFMVEVNY